MKIHVLFAVTLLVASGHALSETFEVGQQNKEFTAKALDIKVGDTVKFTNNDPFFHNVFSLSDAAMFDLGSYPKGESKEVKFEQAGEVQVECAIHPNMQMTITVK
ncbi:Methylamine utilization protein [gamma proteobacterium HdN1]|nr:Methylamine utilization protein [gamma proteobacterium HdN1]